MGPRWLEMQEREIKGYGNESENDRIGVTSILEKAGAAIASFKTGRSACWCRWYKCGVIILGKFSKRWVVFDYEGGSIAAILDDSEVFVKVDKTLHLKIPNSGNTLLVYLEFETVSKLESFCEHWKAVGTRLEKMTSRDFADTTTTSLGLVTGFSGSMNRLKDCDEGTIAASCVILTMPQIYWTITIATIIVLLSHSDIYLAVAQLIPESKYRTNITLAIFLPYAISDVSEDVTIQDGQIELAINETNQDPTILPETYINILRVNNWDPELESEAFGVINSGGFASLAAMELAQRRDVIVAVGEYFSKTAIYSTEVLSYYKIPFCQSGASSERLSNRMIYPYSFRMASSIMMECAAFASWLTYSKIKRVAIVSSFEPLSVNTKQLYEKALLAQGISILTSIYLSTEAYEKHEYTQAYATIKEVDASDYSLIGPRIVWGGLNLPFPDSGTVSDVYGPNAESLVEGYLYVVSPRYYGYNTPNGEKFWQKWLDVIASNPRLQNLTLDKTSSTAMPYDCVKTLVAGLHQFLQKNTQFTPEMLANGSLNEHLLPSVFANTGYAGISASSVTLDADDCRDALVMTANYSVIAGTIDEFPGKARQSLRTKPYFTRTYYS
ncbi:hypothetical protein HDU76_011143 [Blyttiomyces sp. JEL0837]|nr:hypothetical protein HDU76_011143 [Blyttiomyces sp. JEL0837]